MFSDDRQMGDKSGEGGKIGDVNLFEDEKRNWGLLTSMQKIAERRQGNQSRNDFSE